ncbi:MAG: guanylate kinase [Clostridiales Family XIII bacterium]|jgi:guanylate kinase|nr:guanylate kinase [Clostridiales Family XIII bacterium]
MKKGKLFVISGPSGVGKGTICRKILSGAVACGDGGPLLSVSVTTRRPRPGEEDGVSYRFVTEQEFRSIISHGGFLEYAEVFGELYGTPRDAVMETLERGRDVLLEIDVQGALQVKSGYPESILIFILPPSPGEQRRRIEGRGSEDAEQIAKRVGEAAREIGAIRAYDYAVVNDDVDRAVAELKEIMSGRRPGLTREDAEDIAARFGETAMDFFRE